MFVEVFQSECCTAAREVLLLGCSDRPVSFTFTLSPQTQVEKANIAGAAGTALCLPDSLPRNMERQCMKRFSPPCSEWLLQLEQLVSPVVTRVHYVMWNGRERVGLASLLFYTSAVTRRLCVCVRSTSFYNTVPSLCTAAILTSAFVLIEMFTWTCISYSLGL